MTTATQRMHTQTETRNFKPVLVSTVVVDGKPETMVFFNDSEIWSTKKVLDAQEQHQIGVNVAEKYTLYNGAEKGIEGIVFCLQ